MGSIKRRNVDEKQKMNYVYSKSTLHSEALTEHKNHEQVHIQISKADSREEDGLSIKCLQDSLAKKKNEKISKIGYLEESTNRQPVQATSYEPPILVK